MKKAEEEAHQFVEEMRKKLHQFQDIEEDPNPEESGDDEHSQDGSRPSTPSIIEGGGDLDNLDGVQEAGGAELEEPTSRDALDWYMYIMKFYHGSIPQRM